MTTPLFPTGLVSCLGKLLESIVDVHELCRALFEIIHILFVRRAYLV